MNRLILAATILFGLFIARIVYLADSSQNCVFFDLVKAVPLGDKIGHFFLFGVLALGANFAFRSRGFAIGRMLVPFGALLVFLLAAGEELSQRFFASRTCDITDLMADLTGIVVFSALGFFLVTAMRKRRTSQNT
ncbi:MAG: VanZ family protein [Verrucomicrobiota bacterium]